MITWLLIPAGVLTIVNQLFFSDNGLKRALLGMVAALVPMVPEGPRADDHHRVRGGRGAVGCPPVPGQRLPAIEGLARVNVVCADKTGTLTERDAPGRCRVVDDSGGDADRVLAARRRSAHPNASVVAIGGRLSDAPDWSTTAIAPYHLRQVERHVVRRPPVRRQGNGCSARRMCLDPDTDIARPINRDRRDRTAGAAAGHHRRSVDTRRSRGGDSTVPGTLTPAGADRPGTAGAPDAGKPSNTCRPEGFGQGDLRRQRPLGGVRSRHRSGWVPSTPRSICRTCPTIGPNWRRDRGGASPSAGCARTRSAGDGQRRCRAAATPSR